MAVAMHPHTCEICGKEYESKKPVQRTCGWTCRSRLSSRYWTEQICQCGQPVGRRGKWCPTCTAERKKVSRARVSAKNQAKWAETRKAKYAVDAAMRKSTLETSVRNRFNGKRGAVLDRDGHRCRHCGSREQLVVHHQKRREDRNIKDSTSTASDLLTLCRACHINLHRRLGDL